MVSRSVLFALVSLFTAGSLSQAAPLFPAQFTEIGGTPVLGDFNEDGFPDLAFVDGNQLSVLRGTARRRSPAVHAPSPIPPLTSTRTGTPTGSR